MQLTKKTRLWLTIFLGMLAAMAPLSTDMYLPSLPVMTEAFGVQASLIQLTLTMTMAGMAIGQIFAGPISDQKGRRLPLIVGMLAFAASSWGCVWATDIVTFLGCRFLQGLSGAVGIVVARAIARDICDGPELTRFFSMLMLVNGLAPILAPVLGGQLLRFASWRGIFVALTVVGLLLMLAAVKFHESLPLELRQPDIRGSFKNFAVLLQNRYFLGHCLMQCSFFAAFFAYISGSSFVFQAIYHVSAQVYSGIFGGIGICIAVAGIVPARLAGRVPEVSLLAWALIQAVVGAVLLLICIVLQAPLICVLLSLLVIIPMISVMGASSFSLAMRANGRMAGSASALIGFFSMVSGGIMAPLVGINGPEDALPMGIIVLLGTLGALSVFVVMIWPRHHRGGRLAQS